MDMQRWLRDLERIDPFRKERYRELGMSFLSFDNRYEHGRLIALVLQARNCKKVAYED